MHDAVLLSAALCEQISGIAFWEISAVVVAARTVLLTIFGCPIDCVPGEWCRNWFWLLHVRILRCIIETVVQQLIGGKFIPGTETVPTCRSLRCRSSCGCRCRCSRCWHRDDCCKCGLCCTWIFVIVKVRQGYSCVFVVAGWFIGHLVQIVIVTSVLTKAYDDSVEH